MEGQPAEEKEPESQEREEEEEVECVEEEEEVECVEEEEEAEDTCEDEVKEAHAKTEDEQEDESETKKQEEVEVVDDDDDDAKEIEVPCDKATLTPSCETKERDGGEAEMGESSKRKEAEEEVPDTQPYLPSHAGYEEHTVNPEVEAAPEELVSEEEQEKEEKPSAKDY